MPKTRPTWPCALVAAALAAPAYSAAVDAQEVGSHAATILLVLGIGALWLGMRNLRTLRYRRLSPPRRQDQGERQLRR